MRKSFSFYPFQIMPSTQPSTYTEFHTSKKPSKNSSSPFLNSDRMKKGGSSPFVSSSTGDKANKSTKAKPDTPQDNKSDFSTPSHSWPIFFAILPPVVSVFHGDARAWSDLMLLALVGFYLFLVIKVPWELYFAARKRRVNQVGQSNQPGNAAQEAIRSEAIKKLHRQEQLSLLLVLVSPGLGGYLLQISRQFLSDYDKYFSQLNIMIFIFAAGIKPASHLIGLIKNRALHLQQEIHYPNSEVEELRTRLASLESEIHKLRAASATRFEVGEYKQDLQPALIELTRWFQKFELREQICKKQQEIKVDEMEMRLSKIELNVANVHGAENLRSKNGLIWLVDLISRVIWLPLNVFVFCLHCFNYLIPYRLLQHAEAPAPKGSVGKRKPVGSLSKHGY
ncbi:hypothetical protein K7432_002693 [Basidiobolus ranarum]|uniref:Uncharacterized protein n=1 Tax=Basidiobolus ranarum TaxID=34480 RepID=A0ABR2W7D1_9FUNG